MFGDWVEVLVVRDDVVRMFVAERDVIAILRCPTVLFVAVRSEIAFGLVVIVRTRFAVVRADNVSDDAVVILESGRVVWATPATSRRMVPRVVFSKFAPYALYNTSTPKHTA